MTTRVTQSGALMFPEYDGLDGAKSLANSQTNGRPALPHKIIERENGSKERVACVQEIVPPDESLISPPVGQFSPQEKQIPPSPEPQILLGVQTASRNSDFQEVWEGIMEGVGTTEMPHKQTAVLMISWEDGLDDLDTAAEVNDLSDVFTEKFRYTVVKERLTAEKLPAHQLSKHLANFIFEYDSESTLLIIYYAGHGTPGKPGELHFTSSSIPLNKRSARNSIPWHSTEHQLQGVTGDVLLIFDCCYAGNLAYYLDKQRGYWPTKSFEFLAACKQDKQTHPPGPKSFTKALIWALERLLKSRVKFTTHELQMEIEKAPGFPKSQHVQVLDRGDPCDQRLVLAPLPPHSSGMNSNGTNQDPPAHQPKEFFDLRFWYLKSPDNKEVAEVANIFKKLILDDKIHANRIAWIRFGDVNRLRNIVDKWRSLPARKSRTTPQSLTLEIPHFDQGHLQSPQTPASHSGSSSMSDNHMEKSEHFRGQNGTPVPQALPQDHKISETEKSNLSSEAVMEANFSNTSVAIPRHSQWVHPGVLLLFTALCFYACTSYL
ncbi:hypothetical protein G7Y89_g7179 [Cudoniella acicularis]|uniref:Peptidase C14 caspase domain-containing protein n=1 Tax=Cudoniella acicularis TaxID=354080 RepID=A0A8H4RJ26_9HELO|nr:hypothetical protein G7Y89_g7179 [Cudoniella acicularis]